MVGERWCGNPNGHVLQTRGVPRPPRRGVPISSLSERSGYYTGGPGPHEGSGTLRGSGLLEFLPFPGHVVSPDLSQLWNGPGRCWENRTPDRRGPAVWM